MNKYIKNSICAVMAALLVLICVPVGAADTGSAITATGGNTEVWELNGLPEIVSGYDPIPLLCIKVSFDANNNGLDDFDPGNPTKLYADKTSPYYGEQWSYSTDAYWAGMLFSDTGKSLINYYKKVSGGSFYFYAADETSGNNDGVISVVINSKHTYAKTGKTTSDSGERLLALQAADAYIDFSKYDKDKNGAVDYTELAVLFVYAGYENAYSSSKRLSDKNAFPTHAHYTTGSGVTLDKVAVLKSGYTGYVKVGEYMGTSSALSVGTVAHELGHFLGAYDLYDSKGTWTSYTDGLSLMSDGSHNSLSGERSGVTPSYLDPYHMISLGFASATAGIDGEYTLFSRQSKVGDYNIIKVNTPSPDEYYLIENRYCSASDDYFDAISYSQKGIIIWHIDQSCIASGGSVNESDSGHDPGVVVLGTSSINANVSAFAFTDKENSSGKYIFDSAKYKFPVSATSYTSLTADQAANYHLKIEVISTPGTEMKIKITGAYNPGPSVTAMASGKTTSSLTFTGRITDLNGGNATKCGFIISDKPDPTEENGVIVYCKPDKNGVFTATYNGLKTGTKYFCRVFAGGSLGESSKVINGYTSFPPVEHDYYLVVLYRNLTEIDRGVEVRVKPGETLKYSFSMSRKGYVFCGWYTDEELTQKYDMGYTQQTKENISLYAKWARDDSAATLKIVGATPLYAVFGTEIGDAFTVPVIADKEGYTFGGWYRDENYTEPFDFETLAEDAGETVIYAKWDKIGGEETTAVTTTETTATTAVETTFPITETVYDTTASSETAHENKNSGVLIPIIIIGVVALSGFGVGLYMMKKEKRK